MGNGFILGLSFFAFSIAVSVPVQAVDRTFNQSSAGTFNWNVTGNWSPSGLPTSADQARITNNLAAVGLLVVTGAVSGTAVDFLDVGSRVVGTNKLIIGAAGDSRTFTSLFGFINRPLGIIELTNTTTRLGSLTTFTTTIRNEGLLLLRDGATLFVAKFTDGTVDAVTNAGTIQFFNGVGPTVSLNYGQVSAFTNAAGGRILKDGAGTGSFVGEFGGSHRPLINDGAILVRGGVLRIEPRDAFTRGGFQNTASGFIQIDAGAVLEIRRTTNAWTHPSAVMPTNFGTVFLNGGTLRTIDTDGPSPGTNTSRVIVNAAGGLIRGNGLLDFTIRNQGIVEARDGTLSVVASVGNIGTWVSTNFGGAASVLNFTTGHFDLGAGTLLNSNGALRMIGGANVTLSTSYGNNSGTIDFAGAANMFIPNSASAGSLTNELVIKKSAAGTATITTGFGPGQNNFGLVNRGTISVGGGDRLVINTANAFSNPFSNAPSGTLYIDAVSTARLSRTASAWTGGNAPVNAGTIRLNGGVLETADDGTVNSARFLRNIGTIEGAGTIRASISNESGAVVSPGLSLGTLNVSGGIVFGSNSTFVVELGLNPGQSDLLNVGGTLTLDANSILSISGGTVGNVYTVMTFAARSGEFGSYNNPALYTLRYNPNNIAIEVIPEPSSALLAALGIVAVLAVLRRRR